MGLFRNKEVKRTLYVFVICSLVLVIIGTIINISCGIYSIIICTILGSIFFIATKIRYKKIDELSYQLNMVLHGDYMMDITENKEGELSILSSEIYKMTVMLKEQADALKKDKKYLNNSIADISHQLRTPLTSMYLIIPQLQKSDLTYEKRMELVKELNILLKRIDWLVSSLLKVSKIESGTVTFKKEKVSILHLINKAMEPLIIPMELREQKLILDIKDDTSYLGDFSWSVEAIGNILKNCIEHTQRQGIIHVSSTENAVYTEIIISDNGTGIDEEDIPHLFERFYKGKNSSNSSIGIGLALSRMIINEQNGAITVKNNYDKGTKFTIRFYKGTI